MLALVFFALIIGIDRLVSSSRCPFFDPAREVWQVWMPKIKAFIKSAPGTYTYLFVLLITSWVLQTSSNKTVETLLLERSTNLRQLLQDPMRVLFGSAFWVANTGELLFSLLAFTLIATSVERWIGTARTASIFFFGHVGATAIVAVWIWVTLNFTVVNSPITGARDVGSSYGLAALAGLLAFRISRPNRWIYLGLGVLLIGTSLFLDPSFTNWGHAFAFGIGFLSYLFIPRRIRKPGGTKTFYGPWSRAATKLEKDSQ
jgi:membrane associated rhomboid family serine protease